MTLDYFYGQAGELFSFYRIPKALFQEPRFQSLSTDAKTLYGILLDRMSLSVKNGWLDEQNRVFIIFSIEDVKRALCCADNKATKLLRELEKFGLIERKRRGLGKPSLVYVKNFSAESSKSIFQNRDFHDSGGFKNASQDPSKSRCNKTKENDTEMSETDTVVKSRCSTRPFPGLFVLLKPVPPARAFSSMTPRARWQKPINLLRRRCWWMPKSGLNVALKGLDDIFSTEELALICEKWLWMVAA